MMSFSTLDGLRILAKGMVFRGGTTGGCLDFRVFWKFSGVVGDFAR